MWKVIQASVIGTSHTASSTDCQDTCFVDEIKTPNGETFLVALAADGAGSAKESGTGADLTCVTAFSGIAATIAAAATTERTPTSQDVIAWVEDARQAVSCYAEAHDLVPRDLACTLLGAVIGNSSSAFFQIGDGSIVSFCQDSERVVFWPDNGEYANMTRFVTDQDALDHLQIEITDIPCNEIALFTDGIQRLALSFADKMAHRPFFEPMLAVLRKTETVEIDNLNDKLAAFLASDRVNERTDDDKTLILATRQQQ